MKIGNVITALVLGPYSPWDSPTYDKALGNDISLLQKLNLL